MKIIFDRIGFRSTGVHITDVDDNNRGQYHIGDIQELLNGNFEFSYFGIYLSQFKNILPTENQVIEEYIRQIAEKGVCLNPNNIVYAG